MAKTCLAPAERHSGAVACIVIPPVRQEARQETVAAALSLMGAVLLAVNAFANGEASPGQLGGAGDTISAGNRISQPLAPILPRVRLDTEQGEIILEMNLVAAPKTVRNFLDYVRGGFYRNGSFFRTVTLSNQPNDHVKIQVIQGGANPKREADLRPAIQLERTRETGLQHMDGTISMARDGPDTAQDSFFICLGRQPELDFGGKRNPDGQGFAAFGRVVKGMDTVKRIHALPSMDQKLTPPTLIRSAELLLDQPASERPDRAEPTGGE